MKRNAFTIIELLIALFLSSFIMLGMMQAYRNAVLSLGTCRSRMAISRKVCLLFNEIERDFSSMIIPFMNKEILPEGEKNEKNDAEKKKTQEQEMQKEEPKDGDKKSEQQDDEPLKNALIAQVYEDENRRIQGRKFELFKNINFITTHPLQVYGDKRVRLVRVMYELIKDKSKNKSDRPCYNLYRKETLDLGNTKMKEDEEAVAKNKQASIRTYLVTDNVKELYVELITPKPPDEKEKENPKDKKEIEELRLFTWGQKDFTVGVVPKALEVHIVLWDDELKRTQDFQIFIPVFSYPTVSPKKREDIKIPGPDEKQSSEQTELKNGTFVSGANQTSSSIFQSAGKT